MGQGVRDCEEEGFEGLIAKDLASKYVSGRSPAWLKVKVRKEDEFVIGGFTEPSGARRYLRRVAAGCVFAREAGIRRKSRDGIRRGDAESAAQEIWHAETSGIAFRFRCSGKEATFIAPKLVAQIGYTEWTGDGKLRHPVYLGLRDDKDAKDVKRQEKR